jgi:hypothetical protein
MTKQFPLSAEFVGTPILGGFPGNHNFGLGRSHALSLQKQVAQVL